MAQLSTPWTVRQTRTQFAAIAWLRWRIAANSLRRKGGTGELISRIVLYTIFAGITLFLVLGAGVAAFYLASTGHLSRIAWLLWATFILCQFLNIQLGQPGTTFDPTLLIRFPLRLRTYTAIRLFFGILSPANIVGSLISLAIAVGVTLAVPALWLYAFVALAIFAITNVLFTRMIFSWVDRWLSTRRAREVFTAVIFAVSIAIQWANFNFNPAYNHGRSTSGNISPEHMHVMASFYHRAHPILAVFPPELISSSLLAASHHQPSSFLIRALGCSLFAALFLTIFALRMRGEFRGELFSNVASGSSRQPRAISTIAAARSLAPAAASPASSGISPILLAMLGKELLYVRRHMGILYGLLMPILLVLLFASRYSSGGKSLWIFPSAVGYTILTIAPLSYNAFGFEATGSQLYFLAPIHMRDVLLAKNIFSFLMAAVEILAVFAIITYMSGVPSPQTALAAVLWAAGTLAVNAIFGNRRSFTSPKKINPLRMANKQTSQLSALISLGILALSAAVAAGTFFVLATLHVRWLILPVAAIFAAVGILVYMHSLRSIDAFALAHREPLFAELCKQT
jgi:ABC-2 type transport system permease protein